MQKTDNFNLSLQSRLIEKKKVRLVLQFFILGSKRLHRKLNDKVKSRFDCFALYKATGKIKTKIFFEKLKHFSKGGDIISLEINFRSDWFLRCQ